MNFDKRNITSEQAKKILAEHGTVVSLEEAEKILKMAYDFAEIAVEEVEWEMNVASVVSRSHFF